MKNSNFSCLRSVNNQLHNKLSQQNQYESYLKRIDNIVDRKPLQDTSPEFYMNFLHKCKLKSRHHRSTQQETKLVLQNKHLLHKIMQVREKKFHLSSNSYHLNMHEKRNRQIEKINEENLKIAKRITEQYSYLRKSLYPKNTQSPSKSKNSEKKATYACWNYSPIKDRKLPRLVNSPKRQQLQHVHTRIDEHEKENEQDQEKGKKDQEEKSRKLQASMDNGEEDIHRNNTE